MTLFRQLMLFIITLFITMFMGTLYVTISQARDYYEQQLEVTSQDTATSLGLSLSLHNEDKPAMLSMVNAIFDRGYFTKIQVSSMTGDIIISRTQKPTFHKIPYWFTQLVSITDSEKTALVMSGWQQKAMLTIVSDPSIAYFDLWQTSKQLLVWFLSIGLLFIILAYFGTRILFRPLVRVAKQAKAICSNVFHVESRLPKTKELRIVTDAMNRTVSKLQQIFTEQAEKMNDLSKKTYQDSLTKIGNRLFFEEQLEHLLTSEEVFSHGHLLFLDIYDLKAYNNKHGFQKGDHLIKQACNLLKRATASVNVYLKARISGSTFAFIILGADDEKIVEISKKILTDLQGMWIGEGDEISACIGCCSYHYQQERDALLAAADHALTQAINDGKFKFKLIAKESEPDIISTEEWRMMLSDSLSHKKLVLFSQLVKDDDSYLHEEVFTKLRTDKNDLLHAGQFISMAEKLNITEKIDFYALDYITVLAEKSKKVYALNLSSSLVSSEAKRGELLAKLKSRNLTKLLHFEISEQLVVSDLEACELMCKSLSELGYTIGIDRVGANLSPLLYLTRLKVNYLKIDGSMTRGINQSKTKQFFIQHLRAAAETLGIMVVATNIETAEEETALRSLGLSWFQGRFIAEVTLCK